MSESGIKNRAAKKIKDSGRWCLRLGASQYLRAGVPDLLVHLLRPRGRACYLEFKVPGKKPTRLQEAVMEEIRKSGAVCEWVETVEEAMAVIHNAEDDFSNDHSIAQDDFGRMSMHDYPDEY